MKMLRVLMLNGSPRANGNTSIALREMEKIFTESGVAVETVQVGNQAVRGCVACNGCAKLGKCVFDDVVNELAPKFEQADGLVVASPVYYASANATLVACLDRLFYSTSFDKTMKVGASVVCARPRGRGGGAGRRGPADHARSGPQHDLPDAQHRARPRAVRPSGEGSPHRDAFHPINPE